MICRWRHGAGASMRKVAYEGFSVKVRRSPPVSLVLTGFMGVGKTTVGGILAKRGHLHWLDTDQLLEERHGCAVTTLFVQVGESDFRECEAEICRELAEQEGLLITTGGGTLLQPETAALFAAGVGDLPDRARGYGRPPPAAGRPQSSALQPGLAEIAGGAAATLPCISPSSGHR